MKKNILQRMYGFCGARWYNPFQKIWGPKTEVEDAFVSKLRAFSSKDTKVLDLGCGTGENFRRLKENHIPFKEYTGVDMTVEMLAQAKKKFPQACFIQGNVETIKGEYDLIISSWLFEHLTPNQRKDLLNRKAKHLHMYLGGRESYNLLLKLFAYLFHFKYVNDKELQGKKTRYSVATTILESEKI